MTSFSIRTRQDAPVGARDILAEIEDVAGFIPNVFGLIANSPVALAAIHSMNGFFRQSSFTPQEQEIIALSTSVENQCSYCVAGHTVLATAANVEGQVIADVRQSRPVSDRKLDVLRNFVVLLIRKRGNVTRQDVDRFLSGGYSNEQVFELIIGIATKVVTNFASKLAQIPVDDEFAMHTWHGELDVVESESGTPPKFQSPQVATGS
jgi:uncharacterized peroxidase-related enzyme